MKKLIALLTFLLISCSTNQPAKSAKTSYVPVMKDTTCWTDNAKDEHAIGQTIPVYIDKDFSDADRKNIVAAYAELNYALNGYITWMIADDHATIDDDLRSKVESSSLGVVIISLPYENEFVEGNGILAFVPDLGSHFMFVVKDRASAFDLREIVEHEQGHILYEEHLPVDRTLMNPFVQNQPKHIDQLFLRQLASNHRYMKLEHLNYRDEDCE